VYSLNYPRYGAGTATRVSPWHLRGRFVFSSIVQRPHVHPTRVAEVLWVGCSLTPSLILPSFGVFPRRRTSDGFFLQRYSSPNPLGGPMSSGGLCCRGVHPERRKSGDPRVTVPTTSSFPSRTHAMGALVPDPNSMHACL
jgi:hypothetical protein